MGRTLHIVASCTDRKKLSPAVQFRAMRGATTHARYKAWHSAVTRSKAEAVVARELYQGDYWSVVQSLGPLATLHGWKPQLWVSSAGYGVIQETKAIVSYSATFARGQDDSIDAGSDDPRGAAAEWWRCLTTASGPALGTSVTSIAKDAPRSTIMVLVSPSYLDAMADDLSSAVGHMHKSGALLIVSSDLPSGFPTLEPYWIPSRAGLAQKLGGALVSLHARTARHLISTTDPKSVSKESVMAMRQKIDEVTPAQEKRAPRAAMTDADVVAFVKERLAADPKAGHTKLLRALRDSGRACEQARFRKIFLEVAKRR